MASALRLTDEYIDSIGRVAYLWGWPLVNVHNRRALMEQLPEAGLLAGIIPGAPVGQLAMLVDYVRPEQRIVACPNQDVVYGFGMFASDVGPSVIQVPDFGDRFWVYQLVNQRTDSVVQLGAMYNTAPGFYLIAHTEWAGDVPDGITGVFRYDTRMGVTIPRVFIDDTAEDKAAVRPLIEQIGMYPLTDFTGEMKRVDWAALPIFGGDGSTSGDSETQWVNPDTFFAQLADVLSEVPPLPGEEAIYEWFGTLIEASASDPHVAEKLTVAAQRMNDEVVNNLFQFRNVGLTSAHHWTTQRSGARFQFDYLTRTAVGKSNIFVNVPDETAYYYQDLDVSGARLDGSRSYAVVFKPGEIPPVRGFWSLTVYGPTHFFHANELDRFSLGTKNKNLHFDEDGTLTLVIGGERPTDPEELNNWLPAPDGPFSLFLRAYWPDQSILDQVWVPPAVVQR